MSIFSNLFHGRITWQTAASQIETWAQQSVAANPALQATAADVMTELKQAASDAIATADTLAGPLLAAGADVVAGAFNVAATSYLGPFGAVASSASHDAVMRIRDGLKAAIDAEAAALIASLKPASVQGLGAAVAAQGTLGPAVANPKV